MKGKTKYFQPRIDVLEFERRDIITIQANEAEAEKFFSHWEDRTGESVGEEQTQEITVSGTKTSTAVYEKNIRKD